VAAHKWVCAHETRYREAHQVKIDVLILQLAILFLPGLIWAKLDVRYTPKRKPSDIEFFLRAFLFGITSYGVAFLIYWIFGWPFTIVDLANAGTQTVVTAVILKEVLSATIIGFLLSILWIYGSTYKWLTRFLQKIKATKTYGDEDVWDFTLNGTASPWGAAASPEGRW
jgi:hypothetical protein